MNKLLTLGSAACLLALAPLAHAVSIVGDIHLAASNSTAMVNVSTNTVTFNPAAPTDNAAVSFRNGDWSNIAVGTLVSYANFTYSPLSVSSPLGWAPNTVWRIDADSYFVLNTVTIIEEGQLLLGLQGLGVAFHDGFDPTPGLWSFSADSSGSAFSFSSTAQVPPPGVPDGGTTVSLLGIALAGLAIVRRKLSA